MDCVAFTYLSVPGIFHLYSHLQLHPNCHKWQDFMFSHGWIILYCTLYTLYTIYTLKNISSADRQLGWYHFCYYEGLFKKTSKLQVYAQHIDFISFWPKPSNWISTFFCDSIFTCSGIFILFSIMNVLIYSPNINIPEFHFLQILTALVSMIFYKIHYY